MKLLKKPTILRKEAIGPADSHFADIEASFDPLSGDLSIKHTLS